MAIDPVSAAASLFILKSKTRNQAIRNRMLELWKDRTKDPTSQWKKVRKSLGDIGLEAAALKEAQRIWKLHRKDQTRSGSVRDDRKTFDKSADLIYIVKPETEVKLDRWGNYSGKSGYWQELPVQPDGSRMTQLQFHRAFPEYFSEKAAGQQATKNKLKTLPLKKDQARNSIQQSKAKLEQDVQRKLVIDQENKLKREKPPAAIGTDDKSSDTDPYKTDIWTVDPRTGKEVGVITRSKRKELESHLAKNKLKAKRSPGLYIQSTR